jgi:hypothetical protein
LIQKGSTRLLVPLLRAFQAAIRLRRRALVWREMPAAAARLAADPARLGEIRRNLRELPPNGAVFEALDVIATTVRRG